MGIGVNYKKNVSQSKAMTTMPGKSTPPSEMKAGQSSGQVTHARSGSNVENLKDTPKHGAAH